jgi:hypothetical protein
MYGGVTGKAGDSLPMSIAHCAHDCAPLFRLCLLYGMGTICDYPGMEQAAQPLQRLIGYGAVALMFAGMFSLWWQGLRSGTRWHEKVHGSGKP